MLLSGQHLACPAWGGWHVVSVLGRSYEGEGCGRLPARENGGRDPRGAALPCAAVRAGSLSRRGLRQSSSLSGGDPVLAGPRGARCEAVRTQTRSKLFSIESLRS